MSWKRNNEWNARSRKERERLDGKQRKRHRLELERSCRIRERESERRDTVLQRNPRKINFSESISAPQAEFGPKKVSPARKVPGPEAKSAPGVSRPTPAPAEKKGIKGVIIISIVIILIVQSLKPTGVLAVFLYIFLFYIIIALNRKKKNGS